MRRCVFLAIVGLCGAVMSNETRAHAEASTKPPAAKPSVAQPLNPAVLGLPDFTGCTSLAEADRTTKLTASGIEVFNTAPIGHAGCPAFVADFQLDKGSVNATSPEIQFDGRDAVRETSTNDYTYYVMHITSEQCSAYHRSLWVYKKRAGERAFTLHGGGGFRPSWDTGGLDGKGLGGPICRLKPGPGFAPIANVLPPTAGGAVDTYRVVLFVEGAPGQVMASALRIKK